MFLLNPEARPNRFFEILIIPGINQFLQTPLPIWLPKFVPKVLATWSSFSPQNANWLFELERQTYRRVYSKRRSKFCVFQNFQNIGDLGFFEFNLDSSRPPMIFVVELVFNSF